MICIYSSMFGARRSAHSPRIPGCASVGQSEAKDIWRHVVFECDCPENEMVAKSAWTHTNGDEKIVLRHRIIAVMSR